MSNGILLALQTTWNSLPPGVRQIITGWAGEVAASFTGVVVGGLSRALRRKIKGTPAEQELEKAFDAGLQACMATLAPPDTWRQERYCDALAYFFTQDEVADEFGTLVDVRPDLELDIPRLRELFQASGRDLAEMPGLHFDAAMKAFAAAYAEAIERSGVQAHVDQLSYLKQVVARLETSSRPSWLPWTTATGGCGRRRTRRCWRWRRPRPGGVTGREPTGPLCGVVAPRMGLREAWRCWAIGYW